jgi:hypothetical protein
VSRQNNSEIIDLFPHLSCALTKAAAFLGQPKFRLASQDYYISEILAGKGAVPAARCRSIHRLLEAVAPLLKTSFFQQ